VSVIVVSAPSGAGKSTLLGHVLRQVPSLRFSVSHTTRRPRAGERDGVDYQFVTPARFRDLVEAGAFVEYAEYGDNLYGTSWKALEGPLAEGLDLIVEVEVKGARQLRDRRRDACFVFLLPPDMATLGDRLRGRGTDGEETIAKRLAIAEQELQAVEFFDYAVVNADFEQAVRDVLEIVAAERSGHTDSVRSRHGQSRVVKKWRGGVDAGSEGPRSGVR